MIDQIGIALFGVTAVFLSQAKDERHQRFACIFGLIGQPFWFYSAYTAHQFGVLFVCGLYTVSWLSGFFNHWVRK